MDETKIENVQMSLEDWIQLANFLDIMVMLKELEAKDYDKYYPDPSKNILKNDIEKLKTWAKGCRSMIVP